MINKVEYSLSHTAPVPSIIIFLHHIALFSFVLDINFQRAHAFFLLQSRKNLTDDLLHHAVGLLPGGDRLLEALLPVMRWFRLNIHGCHRTQDTNDCDKTNL